MGADFLAALLESCFLGAFWPVDLRAVYLVRAIFLGELLGCKKHPLNSTDSIILQTNEYLKFGSKYLHHLGVIYLYDLNNRLFIIMKHS